ncbi:hypothetical protein CU098_007916, partial [Rhizopus stolonifer]
MTSEGHTNILQDEEQTSVSKSPFSKLKRWLKSSNPSEHTPLLNQQRMTLEPPRKSSARVIFEIVTIVGVFVLISA